MFSLSDANIHLRELLQPLMTSVKGIKSSTLLRAYVMFSETERLHDSAPNDSFSVCYSHILPSQPQYEGIFLHFDFSPRASNTFDKAVCDFSSFDLCSFLRFITPDLVAQPVELCKHFDRKGISLPQACQHIIRIKMSKISSDQQAKAATSADVLDRIFSAYEQIRGYGPDLNKNQFLDLYSLINLYPLDPSETDIAHLGYNKKHFIDAILTLKNQFALSLHQQLDLLSGIYLTPDKMPELIEQVLSDLPPFAQRGDQKSRANALYKCILDVGQAPPLDALSAVLYWKKTDTTSAKTASESLVVNNDVRLENGLIYTLFTATLGQNATNELPIAIFFPSTFFVRKFLRDPALKGRKVDFIFHDEAISELIDHHYHYGSFADDLGKNVRFFSYDAWQLNSNNTGLHYKTVLLFGTQMTLQEQDIWFQHFKNTQAECEIFALLASYEFESSLSPFSSQLDDPRIKIPSIALIPQGINCSTKRRRKLFLRCVLSTQTANPPQAETKTSVYSFALNTDLKTQSLSLRDLNGIEIDQHDLVGAYQSIRVLYREELLSRKATGRKNAPSFSYRFTPDITIWCSKPCCSNDPLGRLRVDAFVCEQQQNKGDGFADRGKPIENTKKRTTRLTELEIIPWLERIYPFSTVRPRLSSGEVKKFGGRPHALKEKISIREEIIRYYTPLLEHQDIALKTLWYLYPNLEDHYSALDYAVLSELACSDLGQLRLSEINPEICDELLSRQYPERSREQLWRYVEIISVALDQAVSFGYCSHNSLAPLLSDRSLQDKLFAQVRSALTKKHFTSDELFHVYDTINQKLDNHEHEYIGVLIRLLTGLDCNTVCGLQWRDISLSKTYQFYRFFVVRQTTNDGSQTSGFKSLTDYRCIPCVSSLTERILQYKQEIAAIGGKISPSDYILSPSSSAPCRPRKLAEISKEIVAEAGINDRIIEVPDIENGTKETNLNRYGGDFFRENFRHWALNFAKLTPDEIQYLLGNKPATTFGIFYCDYLNEASQLMMHVKLQRLDAFLRRENAGGKIYRLPANNDLHKDFAPAGSYPRQLIISLSPARGKRSSPITINLHSLHGADYYADCLSSADEQKEK